MEIRPRRATELVDASFQLLRRFYPQLVTVSALTMAPGVIYRIIERDAMSNPQLAVAHPGAFIGVALVVLLSFVVCDAVLTVAVSQAYLEGAIDLGLSFSAGFQGMLAVLLASFFRVLLLTLVFIVAGVVIAVVALLKTPALFVLLIPFVLWATAYVLLRTFALIPIVLLEHTGPNVAMGRTLRLTSDCTAHVFFSLGLAFVLYFIVSAIVSVLGLTLLTPTTAGIIGAVVIIPIYPLMSVVSTLLYYDLRIRKEGFDLEIMSRELAGAPAPLPAA
jgi:hypothetical protein